MDDPGYAVFLVLFFGVTVGLVLFTRPGDPNAKLHDSWRNRVAGAVYLVLLGVLAYWINT